MSYYPRALSGRTRRIPVEDANGFECLNCNTVTPGAERPKCCGLPALQPVLISPCSVKGWCDEVCHVGDRHVEMCLA